MKGLEGVRLRLAKHGPMEEKKKTSRAPRTTVLVRNIPTKLNEIMTLNGHFAQFGKIINITVLEKKHSAIIKFNSTECAIRARDSKAVVLNCPEIEVLYEPYPRGVEEETKSKPIAVKDAKFEGEAIKR